MQRTLGLDGQIRQLAAELVSYPSFLYLGRGIHHPIALEGALKLKELSYIHAEGYAGGEMKHGPIALIDQAMPVVALTPRDASYDRMVANVEEVRARGGRVIVICHEGDAEIARRANHVIAVPPAPDLLAPLVSVLPLQPQRQAEQVAGGDRGGERLRRGHADLGTGVRVDHPVCLPREG